MSRGFWTRVQFPPVPPSKKLDKFVLIELFYFPKAIGGGTIPITSTQGCVDGDSGIEGSRGMSHSRALSGIKPFAHSLLC